MTAESSLQTHTLREVPSYLQSFVKLWHKEPIEIQTH